MLAIKKARKVIVADPAAASAKTLAALVVALETETSIDVATLYQLDYPLFELAIDILREWRLDRYYASKLRLYDTILQLQAVEWIKSPVQAPRVPDAAPEGQA